MGHFNFDNKPVRNKRSPKTKRFYNKKKTRLSKMKILLLVLLALILIVKTLEYQLNKPQVNFQQEDIAHQTQLGKNIQLGTQIIRGNNGKMYEITIYPARKMYETHLETKQQFQTSAPQPHQPAINFSSNLEFKRNSQQPNLYENSAALQNTQNHYKQFTTNTNYQQQQTLDQQQVDLIAGRIVNQQTADLVMQSGHTPQQQQLDRFLPIVQHQQQQQDLFNNQKYPASQSKASLDTSYNNNPRPFLRIITKCGAGGQCVSQNVSNSDVVNSDFQHQQVLQQSRAHVHVSADKFQQKFNYQFTGNALTGNAAKALRGIPINKGTDLRNRRLFRYCEFVIPQYPNN